MTVPTITPSSAPATSAAPASRSEKPERPALFSELIRSERLNAGNARKNILTGPFNIGFRLQPNEEMAGKARRQSGVGPSIAKIGEYIGRRRERANAVRDRTYRYWQAANLSGCADTGDPEPIVIGPVDCHGSRVGQTLRRPFHDIPGRQSAGARVGSDDEYRSHGSIRQTPGGKSSHPCNDLGDAFDLQDAVSHSGAEKREILEIFRSARTIQRSAGV